MKVFSIVREHGSSIFRNTSSMLCVQIESHSSGSATPLNAMISVNMAISSSTGEISKLRNKWKKPCLNLDQKHVNRLTRSTSDAMERPLITFAYFELSQIHFRSTGTNGGKHKFHCRILRDSRIFIVMKASIECQHVANTYRQHC